MSRSLIVFAVLVCSLQAQEFRATLTGRVTDPSGSSVPGATVVATKSDTNSRVETVTSSEGFYTIPLLPPGVYEVTAEATGFKKYVQSGITLGTNQRVAQN